MPREPVIDRFDHVIEFRKSIMTETDRGCALMTAAYLDDQLSALLAAYFVDDKTVIDQLLDQAKPLGAFSAKIDLAYAIGLIGPQARKDLHLIRKIRNLFGHEPKPLSFNDPPVSDRCRELSGYQVVKAQKPRLSYTRSAMGILALIHAKLSLISHQSTAPDAKITEEVKAQFFKMERHIQKRVHDGDSYGTISREIRGAFEKLLEMKHK